MREVHDGGAEPENQIVALPLDGSKPPQVVAAGRDFYSFPRVSPDGLWLAFTCWDHPNMPWDGTELWVAPARDPGAARPLAGGPGESVFAPGLGLPRIASASSPTATAGGTSTDGRRPRRARRDRGPAARSSS